MSSASGGVDSHSMCKRSRRCSSAVASRSTGIGSGGKDEEDVPGASPDKEQACSLLTRDSFPSPGGGLSRDNFCRTASKPGECLSAGVFAAPTFAVNNDVAVAAGACGHAGASGKPAEAA